MTSKSVSVVVRAKTRKTSKVVKKTGLQPAHFERFQRSEERPGERRVWRCYFTGTGGAGISKPLSPASSLSSRSRRRS